EFTDPAGASARSGASALVDVAGYKTADAPVHVVRAFRDESVPHPSGSIDPARVAQAMEDGLILADLAVVDRRLERLDMEAVRRTAAEAGLARVLLVRCEAAHEDGRPLRALGLEACDRRRPRGLQLLSAKPLLVVANLDEGDLARAGTVA